MTALSVNLNKVALLRNQRDLEIPSVVRAAQTCVRAGAHGITVHPRPDARHIRFSDVRELAALLRVEFNIEGNPFPEFRALVTEVRPTQCTLVPDSPEQSTSDHGYTLVQDGSETAAARELRPIVAELRDRGIRVSLFMDPDPVQIAAAARLGTDRVELYTEPYARAFGTDAEPAVWARYRQAAEAAQDAGLGVNAGHDLNLHNLARFCEIPGILEVSIGHALIADALDMGFERAVVAYLDVLAKTSKPRG
jgi:pyridoxine 5-phosphate synthase